MNTPPPFEMSLEAQDYVRAQLRPREAMEAALVQTFNYEERDRYGRVTMRFAGEFFMVG